MASLFNQTDYKKYLLEIAEEHDARERGFRARLSRALKVQTAYISQVLNGRAHLSLEQAEGVNHFLSHDERESEFFYLLIQFARAGTPTLQRFFELKMKEQLRIVRQMRQQIRVEKTVPSDHQAIYYSSWVYAAVHMLVTIPQFQTRSAIEGRLRIPRRKLSEVLGFLVRVGLLRKKGEQYQTGEARIHLAPDSPLLNQHQQNWRLRAIEQMSLNRVEDSIHFAGVLTLSAGDADRIKERLRVEISECMKIVHASPEERLYGFNVDFFEAQ